MSRIRVLFLPDVEYDNINAQSLNVREIALRLDPETFDIALWYEREPDPRLVHRPGVRLLQLPPRHKTVRILREMVAGYDLIAYTDLSPASYLFLHLPHSVRGRAKTVFHAEAPLAQIGVHKQMHRFLRNRVAPHCDAYTAISEFVARDVRASLHRQPEHILPVGVDTAFFSPPAERGNPRPVALFVGTLIERKGPQYVVDAAVRFPTATFRLVGAGRDGFEEVLRRRISQSGLTNVHLEGPKTQPELLLIMRESDIFLLPSRLEGIPKVTLEAAATGLPCIVFRDYETPSVVDGVTGFQVSTLDEMIAALGRLMNNPSLRQDMGRSARKLAQKFDWDVVAREWQNAYQQIAAIQST